MPKRPLAYFITFTTYGSWLHGDAPGSVDREHNQVGTPWLPPDAERQSANRKRLAQEPYALDAPRREIVRDAVVEACQFRGWHLLALHVRSNHIHLVVSADQEPEFVMQVCKARASRWLNEAGFDTPDRRRWTEHGSTKYRWSEEAVAASVEYTLHRQGKPMAVYPCPSVSAGGPGGADPSPSGSETPGANGPSPSGSEGQS